MPKNLMRYYVLVVEVLKTTKLGPYFDEKEVDDEAKKFLKDMMAKNPRRAQRIQSMLLCEIIGDHFEVLPYEPVFLLELNIGHRK